MPRYPMTKEGESSLREELQKLKSVDRNNVVKAIAEAREHGDLKENAEYHAAKEHYKIVGEDEADAKLSKISINSPLARSLIGKSKGDLIDLETPGGKKKYEILSIQHI